MRSDRESVELFLKDVRHAINQGNVDFIPRRKNIQMCINLNIKTEEAKNYIKNLTFNNYISGPDEDRDKKDNAPFWKFKLRIGVNVIYIKIKIRELNGELAIVSFHEDE